MIYWLASELAISEYTMDDVREEAQMNGIVSGRYDGGAACR